METTQVFLSAQAEHHVRSSQLAKVYTKADGNWFARLIAANPRIVRTFSDHEAVIAKLEEANEVGTLADVASGGYLDLGASRGYREAHKRLISA